MGVERVPRMLRSAPPLRRGALLIRGPWLLKIWSRLCGAAQRTLHRVRDTSETYAWIAALTVKIYAANGAVQAS